MVFTADPVVCFSCSSGGVLFGRAVGRFPRRCQTRFESGCSSPAHSPSSRLVQRASRCRSLSKARLDIFYVGDVGFLRTTLIIYLFIPLLSCDSANILHESAQLALKFMFLYCSPFALKFLSQPFFVCVCFEVSSPSLPPSSNSVFFSAFLFRQPTTTSSPPSTRPSPSTCATRRAGTTTSPTRCTPCTGKWPLLCRVNIFQRFLGWKLALSDVVM